MPLNESANRGRDVAVRLLQLCSDLGAHSHFRGKGTGATKTLAARLVDCWLWEQVENGYMIHDYLEDNPSAAKVQKDRAASAERMRSTRAKRVSNRRRSSREQVSN